MKQSGVSLVSRTSPRMASVRRNRRGRCVSESFVLVVEDPDAPSGTFRHWAVYDIPGDKMGLNEGEDVSKFRQGVNDFGNQSYDGPEPPLGHGVHHYHFRLAALDTAHIQDVQGKAKASAIWDKAQSHLIEKAEVVGTFEAKAMAGETAG